MIKIDRVTWLGDEFPERQWRENPFAREGRKLYEEHLRRLFGIIRKVKYLKLKCTNVHLEILNPSVMISFSELLCKFSHELFLKTLYIPTFLM